MRFPIAVLGQVQGLIARYEGRKPGSGSLKRIGVEDYNEQGFGGLCIGIEVAYLSVFVAELREVTNGDATAAEETAFDDD